MSYILVYGYNFFFVRMLIIVFGTFFLYTFLVLQVVFFCLLGLFLSHWKLVILGCLIFKSEACNSHGQASSAVLQCGMMFFQMLVAMSLFFSASFFQR